MSLKKQIYTRFVFNVYDYWQTAI